MMDGDGDVGGWNGGTWNHGWHRRIFVDPKVHPLMRTRSSKALKLWTKPIRKRRRGTMPCAAGLAQHLDHHFIRLPGEEAEEGKAKAATRTKFSSINIWSIQSSRWMCLPFTERQSSQAKENATTRRSARRWHCWFRRVKMQRPLCDLGLGQEWSTSGPNGSTKLVMFHYNCLNFGAIVTAGALPDSPAPTLTHTHIPTFERPNLQNSRQKVKMANQTMWRKVRGWLCAINSSACCLLLTTPENQNRVYSSHASLHLAPGTKSSRSKDITPAPGPMKAPKRTWYVARCVCVESFECLSCSPCAVFRPFSRRFALSINGFSVQLMHTCRTVSWIEHHRRSSQIM